MNIFDIGIILLLIMFFITGFKRGVIKELVSLIGIIIVFILSYYLKDFVGNLLCIIFPFFKFGGLTVLNIVMYQAIAFLLVFSILLSLYTIMLRLSKTIQKLVNMTLVLWLPSKILGGLVSVIKGWIVLFVVFLVLLIPLSNQSIFIDSALVYKVLYETPILSNSTNNFVDSISEIYDLGEGVSKKTISTNDANLKGLDIILKYKITDKETIKNLVKIHKLDDIHNINSVLNNY